VDLNLGVLADTMLSFSGEAFVSYDFGDNVPVRIPTPQPR
jgi:hypothetical protein